MRLINWDDQLSQIDICNGISVGGYPYTTGMTPVRGLAPHFRVQFDCGIYSDGESFAAQMRILDLRTRKTTCFLIDEFVEFERPHLVDQGDPAITAAAAAGDKDAEHLLGNLRWLTTNQLIYDELIWAARQTAQARPYQLGYEDYLPWSIYAPGEPQH